MKPLVKASRQLSTTGGSIESVILSRRSLKACRHEVRPCYCLQPYYFLYPHYGSLTKIAPFLQPSYERLERF